MKQYESHRSLLSRAFSIIIALCIHALAFLLFPIYFELDNFEAKLRVRINSLKSLTIMCNLTTTTGISSTNDSAYHINTKSSSSSSELRSFTAGKTNVAIDYITKVLSILTARLLQLAFGVTSKVCSILDSVNVVILVNGSAMMNITLRNIDLQVIFTSYAHFHSRGATDYMSLLPPLRKADLVIQSVHLQCGDFAVDIDELVVDCSFAVLSNTWNTSNKAGDAAAPTCNHDNNNKDNNNKDDNNELSLQLPIVLKALMNIANLKVSNKCINVTLGKKEFPAALYVLIKLFPWSSLQLRASEYIGSLCKKYYCCLNSSSTPAAAAAGGGVILQSVEYSAEQLIVTFGQEIICLSLSNIKLVGKRDREDVLLLLPSSLEKKTEEEEEEGSATATGIYCLEGQRVHWEGKCLGSSSSSSNTTTAPLASETTLPFVVKLNWSLTVQEVVVSIDEHLQCHLTNIQCISSNAPTANRCAQLQHHHHNTTSSSTGGIPGIPTPGIIVAVQSMHIAACSSVQAKTDRWRRHICRSDVNMETCCTKREGFTANEEKSSNSVRDFLVLIYFISTTLVGAYQTNMATENTSRKNNNNNNNSNNNSINSIINHKKKKKKEKEKETKVRDDDPEEFSLSGYSCTNNSDNNNSDNNHIIEHSDCGGGGGSSGTNTGGATIASIDDGSSEVCLRIDLLSCTMDGRVLLV